MKSKSLILVMAVLLAVSADAFGQRQLDRAEILQIFQVLTTNPTETWIPAGTIEAIRQQYNASSGYTTDTTVTVKYDGNRFYWEINVNSRTKSAEPNDGPLPTNDFGLSWNRRRVFAWDGQRYTRYFRPVNHAIVNEGPSNVPVVVNGPLTAGIVPWGYGVYTYESLSAAESFAVEVDVGGRKQIHLTVKSPNKPEMVFVLDAAKDCALLSYSLSQPGSGSIVITYGDYQFLSDKWVPTTILIEKYDTAKQPPELLSSDFWSITFVDVAIPPSDSFSIPYETGALTEYNCSGADKPLLYRYSNNVDMDMLLANKFAIAPPADTATAGCAAVAMKYAAAQLGKDVTDQQLAQLVNEPNEGVSLYAMHQLAQQLGFYCLAVNTDVQTLKNLQNCQAILHLPDAEHYVVLEHVDQEYVWLIDLQSNKFYDRTSIGEFELIWTAGTALLVSKEPLASEGTTFTELDDVQMNEIIGSSNGFGYSCTELIQAYDVHYCPEPVGIFCGGTYRVWNTRYGCEEDPEGGECSGSPLSGNSYSICVEALLGGCTITGEWITHYIRACG